MMLAFLVGGVLVGLAASAFFSATETGVYSLNRVRLRVRTEQGQPAAQRLTRLMSRGEDVVITTLLGATVADYVTTIAAAGLLLHLAVSPGWVDLWVTLILTPVALVFGAVIPKDWFRREADRMMYVCGPPLAACVALSRATGLVFVLRALTHWLMRRIDPQQEAADESALAPRSLTLQLLREGAASGNLSTLQRDLIERVMNTSQVRIGSVMIPRQRAATVPVTISRDDFLRIARMAHFSRLPAWQGDPRRIVGVINVFDVLTDPVKRPMAEYVREVVKLSPGDRVPAALLKLQNARKPMAAVEDKWGNCIGILTVKDLVEEIVGDLEAW